jgi:hypothetical protein
MTTRDGNVRGDLVRTVLKDSNSYSLSATGS